MSFIGQDGYVLILTKTDKYPIYSNEISYSGAYNQLGREQIKLMAISFTEPGVG